VEPALAGLSHVLLTRRHHLRLLSNFLQPAQHDAVASSKSMDHVLDLSLGAELLHERLQPAKVVARYTREQVVHGLELQAAVDEVEPLRAGDVHGCAELALRERLAGAEVGGAGAPVGKGDLHVERHGDQVAGEDEDGAGGPGGDVAPEEDVEVEEEVGADADDFGGARPPHLALGAGAGREEEAPGEDVEVEACEGHDGVVGVLLYANGDFSDGIPDEFEAAVVC